MKIDTFRNLHVIQTKHHAVLYGYFSPPF